MEHDWRYIRFNRWNVMKISARSIKYQYTRTSLYEMRYYTISRKGRTESTFEQLRAIKAIVKKCSSNLTITLDEGKWSQKSFNSACFCRHTCVFCVCTLHLWNSYSCLILVSVTLLLLFTRSGPAFKLH